MTKKKNKKGKEHLGSGMFYLPTALWDCQREMLIGRFSWCRFEEDDFPAWLKEG